MNDPVGQSKWLRIRRRWFVPAFFLLALLLAAGRYWHAVRTAPGRCFRSALAAFARGDLDAVFEAAEALRGPAGYEPHQRLLEGMLMLRTGRPIDAIVEFGHAREHPDTRAWAHTLSGEALYRTHQFRDAQRILTIALQLDPGQIDAHRWLAALYYDLGAMDHALGHLQMVANQVPTDPRPHRLIGLIHKDFEEYRKAIDAYRESLRRDSNQPDKEAVCLELAECLVKQQRHAEAWETLTSGVPSAQKLCLQAECRRAQGAKAAAEKLVDEALRLEPKHLNAWYLKGQLALEAGQAAAAVEALRKAVECDSKHWRSRYALGMAYRRLGDVRRSAEELKATEELRKLWDRFAALHTQAIKDANNADLRYELGQTAQRLDKTELAVSWFQAALALDPEHKQAQAALQALTR